MTTEVLSEGWDQTFLDISSKLAEPFCAIWHLGYRLASPLEDPQKFENCATKAAEIGTRILMGLGGICAIVVGCLFPLPVLGGLGILGLASRVARAVGFFFQKGGFTYVRGPAQQIIADKPPTELKVLTWNICGPAGGLSLDHGGVIHWRKRIDTIIEKIKEQNADVVATQEGDYDTACGEALSQRLGSCYPHSMIHIGPNSMGSVSGMTVHVKRPIHRCFYTPFTTNHWSLNRGFLTLELKENSEAKGPFVRVIVTHLIHGNDEDAKKARVAQVAQIVNSVAQDKIPTILMGDLNIERDSSEGAGLTSAGLIHGYRGAEPTCTNRLVAQWTGLSSSKPDETIDNISVFENRGATILESEVELIKAFQNGSDPKETRTALSDHHALVAKVRLPAA
jgi:endonuclease/exonuclease/phosphatase family metal-dependent hydrolase